MNTPKCNIAKFVLPILCFILSGTYPAYAQLTVSPNHTATVLASTLAGPGVTILNPTLTCPTVANGTFTSTGTLLGMSNGIVLTTGHAAACIGPNGAPPGVASFNNGAAGDPALGIYLPPGTNTYDACILQFDVVAAGDSIGFNYQFGSQEYYHSTCGQYPDIFAFFISGPGIAGTPNIALVPGTNIPVEINSVNAGSPGGPGGLGPGVNIVNCTSLGPGSPFTTYFINNWGGTQLSYTGFTTKLRAAHVVNPCDTYHLKLSIADADNSIYDSGVFLEAASLTPPTIPTPPVLCVGGTTTLTPPSTGGTWISGNTTVATIGSSSGIVTGVGGGTATISYLVGPACAVTTIVTVNTLAPITGTLSVCAGNTTTLTDAAAGGTWSSSNITIATIGSSSGIVNGLSAGTTTISYTTAGGCSTLVVVTVTSVSAITGTPALCLGSTTTLTDATAGGIWSSSNIAVATVTGGLVTGVSAGTATISYTLASGCYTTITVTVNAITPISGTTFVCAGNTIALTDATAGGTWSSINTAVATIGAVSGIVNGISGGTSTISYTTAAGCSAATIVTVTAVPPITGPTMICIGATAALSDGMPGGGWTSSNTAIASVSLTGVVTGISGGSAIITYTVPGGCYATIPVTISTFSATTVNAVVCSGSSYAFAGATYTITGTYTHTFVTATCDSVVTLNLTVNPLSATTIYDSICNGTSYIFAGTAYTISGTYTYTGTNIYGCDSTVTLNLFVKPTPPTPAVVTPVTYCLGQEPVAPLSAAGVGLTWYTTIGGAGSTIPIIPSDAVAGTTLYYVGQIVDGCPGPLAAIQVIVYPAPVATIFASRTTVCQYDTATLFAGTVPSGAYSWYAPGSDIVSGTSTSQQVIMQFNTLGHHRIILTVSENGQCSAADTIMINVIPAPASTFYVKPNVCLGDTVTVAVSSTTPGVTNCVWNFEDATILTATDQVWGGPYGVAWSTPGIHYIQMSAAIGQCVSQPVTDTVDVHPLPDASFTDLTTGSICAGDSALLSANVKDPNYLYQWSPTHFFKNTNTPEIYGVIEMAGYVKLEVTSEYGCRAIDSLDIDAHPCCELLFPNAFTPNGDGKNDIFRPIPNGHHRLHVFLIENRFGQVVFETVNERDGWNGSFNGVPQDMDVYYYYIKYDCNGRTIEEKGDVTLVR